MTGAEDSLKDLELLINSNHPFICVETPEEERVAALLKYLADGMDLKFFAWTPTKGLKRSDQDAKVYGSENPVHALQYIDDADLEAIFYFRQLSRFFEKPSVVEKLQDVAEKLKRHRGAVVITDAAGEIPPEIERLMTRVKLPFPTRKEYQALVKRIIRDMSSRAQVEVAMTAQDAERFLDNLKGLTLLEAEKAVTRAIVVDRRLTVEDIEEVFEAKRKIIEREGVLEYYPREATMADVSGLVALKEWLKKRKQIFLAPERAKEFGLDHPKGILLLGVQGCGKSLCAKVVAREWGLPLLKLDPSNLYNKYIGESEKNLKKAMRTAEAMAPLVLWIDEIEKALSGAADSDMDGGVARRMFGTLLGWLQEKKEPIFVIATSNDVSALPPELLRKGRFDEIFFVDLPEMMVRKDIFAVHLKRKKQDPAKFELDALARAAAGFSGAEIEQAVVSALYTAFSGGVRMSTELVLEEIGNTHPLSRTMAEKVEKLRKWAKGRTVAAG